MASQLRGHVDINWNSNNEDAGRRVHYFESLLRAVDFDVSVKDDTGLQDIELRVGSEKVSGLDAVRHKVTALVGPQQYGH